MKPNELRIGNWVMYDNRYFQIECNSVHFPYLRTAEFGAGVVEYRNIFGIPLTQEILLKCGFEIKKDEYGSVLAYQKGIKPLLISGRMKGYYTASCDYNIQYLHELQNLYYALTKTELIINL